MAIRIAGYHPDQARAIWHTCIVSAFRTALACTIVFFTTLYTPDTLRHLLTFPAFSYTTVILIITDATLGHTVRGCWLGLYATVQVVGPAILSLWLIGPARLSTTTTALAVAVSAFVVALPESTHLVSKRIALGQIVLIYVSAFVNGVHTDAVMHPVHVAASTAVGVLACVLALLLPYPRLACYEVKTSSKLLTENASERLKLFVKAFCAEDDPSALASISLAKSLNIKGAKLLQHIIRMQEIMQWEKIPIKFLKPYYMSPGDRFQDLEVALKGMEIALTSIPSFPVEFLNGELRVGIEGYISLTIKQELKGCLSCDHLTTVPESKTERVIQSLQTLQSVQPTQTNLPFFFFLFCLKLLHKEPMTTPSSNDASKKYVFFFKGIWSSKRRLMPAFKCSLSLGLAVLFGLIYSKENGYWSGLPVAISLASSREATFRVANVKAQGTVLGSVYGVLSCFLLQRFFQIRFLSLLPWFLFSSFLQRSKMYGQAGGISAVIGAVLILGRKNIGPPSEFAVDRIVETFIGLFCSVFVELLLQPTRASTLAKMQLCKSLGAMHACVGSLSLHANKAQVEENLKRLKIHVNELGKFIAEAEVEPNFWFLPFHSACYGKLMGSLSKMMDLLLFWAHAMGLILEQESLTLVASHWKEVVGKLDGDLILFKEMVGSSMKCLEEVTLIKSLTQLEKELQKNNISYDLEKRKSPSPNINIVFGSGDEDGMEKITSCYLQHLKEVIDKIHDAESNHKELKVNHFVLNLSALGFCMSSLVKETSEIAKGITELVQWENPSAHINLLELSCKIHSLHN